MFTRLESDEACTFYASQHLDGAELSSIRTRVQDWVEHFRNLAAEQLGESMAEYSKTLEEDLEWLKKYKL